MYKSEIGETVWVLLYDDIGNDDEIVSGEVTQVDYVDSRYPCYVIQGQFEYSSDKYEDEFYATEGSIHRTKKELLKFLRDEKMEMLNKLSDKIQQLNYEIAAY